MDLVKGGGGYTSYNYLARVTEYTLQDNFHYFFALSGRCLLDSPSLIAAIQLASWKYSLDLVKNTCST